MRVGIVGFGRSGTTLTANTIRNFLSQENREDTVYHIIMKIYFMNQMGLQSGVIVFYVQYLKR